MLPEISGEESNPQLILQASFALKPKLATDIIRKETIKQYP